MARPVVRYATTSDGLEIAYQVLGDGPLDVVIVPGMVSNLDRNADYPFYGCYLRRFPRFARTIVLDGEYPAVDGYSDLRYKAPPREGMPLPRGGFA